MSSPFAKASAFAEATADKSGDGFVCLPPSDVSHPKPKAKGGALCRTRTGTSSRTTDFKSVASTSSAKGPLTSVAAKCAIQTAEARGNSVESRPVTGG